MKKILITLFAIMLTATTAYANNADSKLAEFSTSFNAKNGNRTNNIRLAAEALDGFVIWPGDEFSYNDAVGSTSRERGYKLATVFMFGEETKGYGGGVCQVSSTLFNAAEIAGMEITERHTHSRTVAYVDKGRDATTSYKGKLDFKFVNPYDEPVVINTSVYGGVLTVTLSVW